MTDRLRWGVLGAARIVRAVVPRLHELPRHQLVAIASRDRSRAIASAERWQIPHALESYEALLAREDIDVVYIPLPNVMHAEWTIKALEAGKHVLCEKPLALSVAEVDAIARAAARTGRRVAEAFMYRHHPLTARVREIVARGDLGGLRLVRGCFSFSLERPEDIRWDPSLGGGALWDVGCYPVSYARMVVGREPTELFAVTGQHARGVDVECAGVLRFGDATMGVVDCSLRAAFRSAMEIVGSDAVLQVDAPFKPGLHEQLTLVRGDRRIRLDVAGEAPYAGEIEDMARQILDGAPPGLPLEDSRGNVATIVALHRSAREARPVALAEAAA